MKKVAQIYKAPPKHWVGDGFYVSSMFSYNETDKNIDPFLLLDYNAPYHFKGGGGESGVGSHPHKGFETVTIAYSGEVEHADSHGGGGIIASGDVQWMTAGSGILHQEFHSKKFAKEGGVFEMVQLWVNLPKAHKLTPPKYQAIRAQEIPSVALEGSSKARIIAGELDGIKGPATTFSPINLWDLNLKGSLHLPIPKDHNLLILVREGLVALDQQEAGAQQLITFQKGGEGVRLEALKPSSVLVLMGLPLNEPVIGYGPFVMNTREEISQALADLQAGLFGELKAGYGG
ncbi:pirin family protein [Helicobacter ailurogastricus]|uniref:Pirin n=1 Tax=Helicobacter ailurogastricus TaxID=1578720 RepID=A0A0K2XIJ0_9HELI|nr:pirin family protein [Helicobacter ailurogastricus]CRF41257.1 Pirin [Helicobacter ailurogastricus]CRF43312.1 Pirin [Helicobacter ailurogastricus]CRF44549.1 Pirin [Helicobacter ailurogastricus]